MTAFSGGPQVQVWSLALRCLHWTLALSTIVSFATHEGGGRQHEWTGYVAWACTGLRVALGLVGPSAWRFAGFVRGARTTWAYARAVLAGTEARHLGHNPVGGWMVVLLLTDGLATGFTGWLYTTDRFWGLAWLEDLHGALGHAFIPLVVLHVAGVVFTSLRHRENLAGAMVHGRKRAAGPGDVG